METKNPKESRAILTEIVLPNDTNNLNNLMGGRLLHWMDISAGVGYVIYKDENLDFELSYNRLLNSNQNGFHKGELNLGISTSISSLTANRKYKNLQGYSIVPNFFRSVLDWINRPLAHGYRESM